MAAALLEQLLCDVARDFRDGASPAALVVRLTAALPEAADDPSLHYHIGYFQLQAGRAEEGAHALRRCIALAEDAQAWLYLGYALIELGGLDEACTALERSLALGGPEQARYELAYALHLAGRDEEAARVARLYVLRERNDPDGWELYDAVCRRLGREATYRRFVSRHGDEAMTELLRGRDEFSMGAEPFPVPGARDASERADAKRDFLSALGSAYVGTARDDGLRCTTERVLHLTRADICAMLARVGGVVAATHRELSGVIAADSLSRPVAVAAAELYGLPLLDGRVQPPRSEQGTRTLFLQLVGHDWLSFARATWAHRESLITVVLAFDWIQSGLPFQRPFAPDICGALALDVRYAEERGGDEAALVRALIAGSRARGSEEAVRQRQYYRSQPGLRFR